MIKFVTFSDTREFVWSLVKYGGRRVALEIAMPIPQAVRIVLLSQTNEILRCHLCLATTTYLFII